MAAREGFELPGLMVSRQGPKGELSRTEDGQAKWSIERPHPWREQVGDFKTFGENPTDVSTADGVLVWLALVPRPDQKGVMVSLVNGGLWVKPHEQPGG